MDSQVTPTNRAHPGEMHARQDRSEEVRARPPHGIALAIVALAFGGLFIGTGEFAAMSLLPALASGTGVSVPEAGGYVSAYALGVVVGAPLLAVFCARRPQKSVLIGLILLFALGCLGSTFAPGHLALLGARFVSGLPHGAYYGVASLVAAQMVAENRRSQAIGLVMLGLAAANVAGVPAVTWLGQALGWRAAFGAVAGGGVLTAVLIVLFAPRIAADTSASPLKQLKAFGRLQVWLTLAVAAIGFGGMFAVYSYITPTLTEVSHLAASTVPWVLALWGGGMVVGNLVGGWMADRALLPAIFGMLLWNVLFLGVFALVAAQPIAAMGTLFLVGTGFSLVPALQTRLMNVAGDAQTLAAALNHSAFNIANALGATLGGLSIAHGFGWASTGWVGAGLAAVGLLVMLVSARLPAEVRQ